MKLSNAIFVFLTLTVQLWSEQPNVLLISVDDLKPAIGAYGDPIAITPNMDALAQRGTIFLNAHVQQAVCGPSRNSFLTGLRPDNNQVWDLKTKMRDRTPHVITLPQAFKRFGYETTATGKVFDFRCVDSAELHDAISWSRPYQPYPYNPEGLFGYLSPDYAAEVKRVNENMKAEGKEINFLSIAKELNGMPAFENIVTPDDSYDDGRIANTAIDLLDELNAQEKPFFLAVGFKKPHLPFVAPRKYWELYQREQFVEPAIQTLPKHAPEMAFQDSWELKNGTYQFKMKGDQLDPEFEQTLRHGYYASTSYADAQMGRVIRHLDKLGLTDNTIIVLWGDHGYHLGDHGMWCKHTNYEQSTRTPLMVIDPRQRFAIQRSEEAVEFIDIYPTLLELTGIPARSDLDGKSLVPHLVTGDDHKAFAVSQFPRGYEDREVMGYAYRTGRYRFIEWVDNHFRDGIRADAPVLGMELYDYKKDPDETVNLADHPEYAAIAKSLARMAREFRGNPRHYKK